MPLTIQDAARELGVRLGTLQGYLSLGRMRRRPDGLVDESEIERWRERQKTALERRKRSYLSPRRTDVD